MRRSCDAKDSSSAAPRFREGVRTIAACFRLDPKAGVAIEAAARAIHSIETRIAELVR